MLWCGCEPPDGLRAAFSPDSLRSEATVKRAGGGLATGSSSFPVLVTSRPENKDQKHENNLS